MSLIDETSLDEDLLSQLEPYSHIHKMIKLSWGTVSLDKFISHLLLDSRDGTRAGFPPAIASVLVKLQTRNELYLSSNGISLHREEIPSYGW